MNTLIAWLNASTSGLISAVLLWAILSPRVHDGIVVKVGLICMALGFGAIALRMLDGIQPGDVVGLARSLVLANGGFAVVLVGYVWRAARSHHSMRRRTDWADLENRPMEREA